jgi:hypothetical protein
VFVSVPSSLPLDVKHAIGTPDALHNWAHFSVFAVTALLFATRNDHLLNALVSLLPTLLWAVVLEALQRWFCGNLFEWDDV